jgi:hypothetical protein
MDKRIWIVIVISSLLSACSPKIDYSEVVIVPSDCQLMSGEEFPLSLKGPIPSGTTINWQATKGTVSPTTGVSVNYIAPQDSGKVNVTAIFSLGDNQHSATITCQVIAPTPTITPIPPTATHTETPLPSETPIPDTPTPLPCPLLELFPQVWGCEAAFIFKNAGGALEAEYVTSEHCVHSGVYGLQLTYSNAGAANAGWGVQWNASPTGHFNASGFSILNFWVRGSSGGETFQIGIKDTSGKEVKLESSNLIVVSDTWTQVAVPLSSFEDDRGRVNMASIANLNFGFNRNHGIGTICIDDLVFSP